uniref:Cotton fiber protein n=1 Tax=Noccaea caerulescens TaxID=107243 RepID=A0A1J3HLK8_NOCCA
MKKAADFVKHIIDMLASLAKDKTKELKKKTRAFKTRLVIFSLLHNRNMVVSSFSHKLKAKPTSKKLDDGKDQKQDQNLVVVYSHNTMSSTPVSPHVQYEYVEEEEEEEEEEEKYPDLRHSLFEAEGSVIEMVKHSKEDKGEEFRLEDEIDKVADLFITRFHRQMWLQKQLSLETQDTSS